MQSMEHNLVFSPKRLFWILVGVELVALTLSLIGQYLRMFPNSYSIHSRVQEDAIREYISSFDVNSEENMTTYYSVTLAAISSLLLAGIAYMKFGRRDRYRFEWAGLSLLLLYISMDDASVIHEKFSRYLRGFSALGGWFEYKWVIAGLIVLALICIIFFRFWVHLETRYKVLFLLSGMLFFGGAIGTEMLGGHWAFGHGSKNFTYVVLNTLEQGLQYIGLTLLVFSLFDYLKSFFPRFNVLPRGQQPATQARGGA